MTQSRPSRIRIIGPQHEQIDADLMAQIVVMLGRELAQAETASADADDAATTDTPVQTAPVQEQDDDA